MQLLAKPALDGFVPIVDLEMRSGRDLLFARADLNEVANGVNALRIAMQRAMALHQLLHDRSVAPLLMLASEGRA